MQGMNSQARSELVHEVAEFQLIARRTAAAGRGGQGAVLALLRARIQKAVLEPDTMLIGLLGSRIAVTSTNYRSGTIQAAPVVRDAWTAGRVRTGTASITIGLARNTPVRYSSFPVRLRGDKSTGTFVAAVRLGSSLSTISRVTRLQVVSGVIALLLGTVLAWLIAGRVLRPVRETTELARQISDTDISGRIPVRGRNEISELADTFNRMLDRLQDAVAGQRQFLADAGHELRTPLTIVQGNLDTLVPATPDDAETLAIASSELTRMSRMVTELTLLASSDRPDFLHVRPTDVREFTVATVAKARSLGDRPWRLAGSASGVAVLDPERMTQALMQLAANAARYTRAGTPVDIGSAVVSGRLEFTVADHGPGIPPADRVRVFERFARLDQPRSDGTGLGLAIVAAICAAHGGGVAVGETRGGGASFVISVPLVRPGSYGVTATATGAAPSSEQGGRR